MSKANKAFKYRIYPTKEQEIMLSKTFGCVRFVYNQMLTKKIAYYKQYGKSICVTPAKYKKDFEWLREVDALALANAQLQLQTAYNNFFRDTKIGFPKYRKKSFAQSYTTNRVGENIRIEGNKLRLPKIGYVRIKLHRSVPSEYILKSVTVSRTSSEKYFASILYEYESEITPVEVKTAVGLDFSMHNLFVSSDGDFADYPRYYRALQDKLAKEQRKLSHCVYGSNNYYKQKHKVALINEKISNQRKDFLHKLSREITNLYDAVCIEDLNMRGMAQALNFGNSVADNGWGMFTTFLSYKLQEVGKQLIKIDKFYPSSQLCSSCGHKQPMPLSDRTYVCDECGFTLDRDINAAINILNEGLRLLTLQ